MSYPYAHLRTPINSTTGVADKVLWAPIGDFTVIGCPTPNATTPVAGDQVTVTVNHTFSAGKGFFELVTAPQKNKLDGKTIGELGSTKQDLTYECFLPGNYAALHEFVKNAANQPGIALIQDGECDANIFMQLGCDCLFAWWTFEWSTGDTKSGQKGYKGTLNYTSQSILLYNGTITKHP